MREPTESEIQKMMEPLNELTAAYHTMKYIMVRAGIVTEEQFEQIHDQVRNQMAAKRGEALARERERLEKQAKAGPKVQRATMDEVRRLEQFPMK